MWRYVTTEELYHHGIPGMKWGVRRYQNEDGSLTAAGKERYGGKQEYNDSTIRRVASSSLAGGKHAAKLRQNILSKRIEYEKSQGKDTKRLEEKHEAQKAANDNLEAYTKRTSTGKMLIQNYLFTPVGGHMYREARARGESRVRSMFEGSVLLLPLVSTILRYKGNKKAYGDGLVLSGMKDGDVL